MPEGRRIRDLAGLDDTILDALRRSLGTVRTLDDLLEWARSRVPPVRVNDVITQDEYSHDVLIAIEPPLWLAFEVT